MAAGEGFDKRKQSLYFPENVLNEIKAEAARQDRSLSWLIQQAWKIAAPHIQKMPSPTAMVPAPLPPTGTSST